MVAGFAAFLVLVALRVKMACGDTLQYHSHALCEVMMVAAMLVAALGCINTKFEVAGANKHLQPTPR